MKAWSYIEELEEEKKEILAAIEETLFSGKLILGDQVDAFENNYSLYSGCKYGIGVNSGTDAIFLSLKALNIGSGDEVITVANTAVPTVSAITSTGATPVFVDINKDTYLIDESLIEEKISDKTKCILPVHLYGQCANMSKIQLIANKYNLKIVEDCAQSHGSKQKNKPCGSFGDLAAYSFYPTKVLGTYGDGGLVCTKEKVLRDKLKRLRYYGMEDRYYAIEHGYNSRLDEIQAAILNVKFKYLNNYLQARQNIAERYSRELEDTDYILPLSKKENYHSYYMYVIRHPKRDDILKYLKEKNINLSIAYPWPIHTMSAYRYLGYNSGDLPNTEQACKEIFSLPIYPKLSKEDQLSLIVCLKNALLKL